MLAQATKESESDEFVSRRSVAFGSYCQRARRRNRLWFGDWSREAFADDLDHTQCDRFDVLSREVLGHDPDSTSEVVGVDHGFPLPPDVRGYGPTVERHNLQMDRIVL